MSEQLYFLLDEHGEAVPFEGSFEEWLQRLTVQRSKGLCLLASTATPAFTVQTAFIGMNHGREGQPEVFVTWAFGTDDPVPCRYYATRAEALEGHEAIIRKINRHAKVAGGYS